MILRNSYPYYTLKVADGPVLGGLGQGQEGARDLNIGAQAALLVARRTALALFDDLKTIQRG